MAIAANFGFKVASVDIRAVFLQSKVFERDVIIEPPADMKKPGVIWKLKKPLYGLNNTSQIFWLWVREVFLSKMNLHTLDGNEAIYFRNIDGQLLGTVITHVDDFNMAGTDEFQCSMLKYSDEWVMLFFPKENINQNEWFWINLRKKMERAKGKFHFFPQTSQGAVSQYKISWETPEVFQSFPVIL